ncbi:MAG: glycosyltransferase, partial [Desulfovibrio sp.]|nr:glycosyltransferase [Desulfovibrio sp.]
MQEYPKVSVIIPVYNTEPYLRRCLDSVCGQTLREIEIICVNDGSTDGSLEILREYAQKDSRVKVIELEENKGAGAARNAGIDAARGEYIGFVDSDDYVDLDFYETLYVKAQETQAEVVKGADWELITSDGIVIIENVNAEIRLHPTLFKQYVTAIFKTAYIHDNSINFPEGIMI